MDSRDRPMDFLFFNLKLKKTVDSRDIPIDFYFLNLKLKKKWTVGLWTVENRTWTVGTELRIIGTYP